MVRILLNGCCGKMGTVISSLIEKYPTLSIVCGIDKFSNTEKSYPVFKNFEDCNVNYDVILDFSRPDALNDILSFSISSKIPVVLCSTGYTAEDLNLISEASSKIPVFRSGNMSLGINLINILLRKISPILYENFDVEIIEKHHNQKVDAPSGTAVMLADSVKNSLKDETIFVHGRDGIAKRQKKEIGIHAVRGGGIIGDHDVIFAGDGEVIELSHKAISREVFAVGALKACEYMASVSTPGLYNMEDVINLTL